MAGNYLLADLLDGVYSAHSGGAVPVQLMGKGESGGRFKPCRQSAVLHNITGFDKASEFSVLSATSIDKYAANCYA
jgi:hypothetical protein